MKFLTTIFCIVRKWEKYISSQARITSMFGFQVYSMVKNFKQKTLPFLTVDGQSWRVCDWCSKIMIPTSKPSIEGGGGQFCVLWLNQAETYSHDWASLLVLLRECRSLAGWRDSLWESELYCNRFPDSSLTIWRKERFWRGKLETWLWFILSQYSPSVITVRIITMVLKHFWRQFTETWT